jgi:hypothetical protein
MRIGLRIAAMAVGPLLVAASLAAQDGAKTISDQNKTLDALVGTWDVAITFKVGPGQERQGKATCETKWILDRRALQQEYRSTWEGKPFNVLQLIGYDASRKKFFEIKLDNLEGGAMYNQGALSDDGKVLTQVGDRVDSKTGKAGKIRTVTTFEDKDHYTLEWYLPDDDGKEEKAVTLRHTRKPR